MRQHPAIRWREIILGLATCAITLMFSAQALTRESVRAELAQSQRNEGLTVAWVNENGGVQAVSFEKRKVIPLKDSLQAFRPEGFKSYNFPRVATDDLCWSHKWSKAAATMFHPPEASLGIYDLSSKATQMIEARVEARMHFTSQCWSPDDKQVTYDSEGSVKVYQLDGETPTVRVLTKGTDVTWSPDGNWIAFRDHDTYYAIRPDGSGRKKLFHKKKAVSGLYWSPDSRFVAYVSQGNFFEQFPIIDAEVYMLRARRLEDGSDDRLCPDSVGWYANYHWITSRELMKHP